MKDFKEFLLSLNALFTFVTVAAVVFFLVVKPVNALMNRRKAHPEPDPSIETCPHCLSDIPAAAVCAPIARATSAQPWRPRNRRPAQARRRRGPNRHVRCQTPLQKCDGVPASARRDCVVTRSRPWTCPVSDTG